MSTFRGIDFFGSGPHRVVQGARAQTLVPLWVINFVGFNDSSGTEAQGDDDQTVTVTGRLVGATEALLWAKRDALMSETAFAYPAKKGTLVDNHGRSWTDLVMVSYAEDGPIDRGRSWSIGYVVTLRDVTSYGP
ncbi:MAG: hypothetical protein ACI89L_001915 [Phycisphaerales bacterium]|jgi:hypothetical protein